MSILLAGDLRVLRKCTLHVYVNVFDILAQRVGQFDFVRARQISDRLLEFENNLVVHNDNLDLFERQRLAVLDQFGLDL